MKALDLHKAERMARVIALISPGILVQRLIFKNKKGVEEVECEYAGAVNCVICAYALRQLRKSFEISTESVGWIVDRGFKMGNEVRI
jgi:hypothetical protein